MKKGLKVFATVLLAGVLFGFAGCKVEAEGTVAVESVTITSTVTEVTVESTITLKATVSPDNATDPSVTWTSSDKTVATVDSSGVVTGVKAGTATITAKAGEKSATVGITVNRKVVVGDIILQDLTIVSSEGYAKNESNPAVAIVAGFNANGAAIGLGLKKSNSTLMWAKYNTTGYNTSFTDIIAKYSGNSSSGYTFTGDCDGSDNWEYICSVDPEGSANAATNYPAFNFAANYGTNQEYTGDLASGWYIPSISELYEIYKNKETLQASLTKVSGFTIGTSWYWSSSQSSYNYDDAYELSFSDGYVDDYLKYRSNSVLVVRAF